LNSVCYNNIKHIIYILHPQMRISWLHLHLHHRHCRHCCLCFVSRLFLLQNPNHPLRLGLRYLRLILPPLLSVHTLFLQIDPIQNNQEIL